MTKDEDRFEALLRALFETFGQEPTPGQILGYRLALDSLPIAELELGIARAMRSLKFLPKPVELRALAGVMATDTRAILAWGVVKQTVHRLSAYGSPDFDDPVINAAIRNMGGWIRLCNSPAEEFDTWVRKDFERIYAHLSVNGVSADQGRALAGIHDEAPKRVVTGLPPVDGQKRLEAAS